MYLRCVGICIKGFSKIIAIIITKQISGITHYFANAEAVFLVVCHPSMNEL
jgi:hypothetical protein